MRTAGTSLTTHMTPCPVTIGPDESLDRAIRMLELYGFRHLPVVEQNKVVGMLSDHDLRLATSLLPASKRLRDHGGAAVPGPERVEQVMKRPVFCLDCEDDAWHAAEAMVERRIGAVPVLSEGMLIGIVTETNLLAAFLELCRGDDGACDAPIADHMHSDPACVPSTASIEEALDAMDSGLGHLCVVDHGELRGFVSARDLYMGISREMIEDTQAQSEGRVHAGPRHVADVMTEHVLALSPRDSMMQAARSMLAYHISALPLFDGRRLVGMLTQRDILEYYASLREPMEQRVTASGPRARS